MCYLYIIFIKYVTNLSYSFRSTLAPNSSALDTQFKICIPNAILGTGHGAQPSYSALASMTAGLPPTYLKIPTQFPSTKDKFTAATGVDEDSDMDLD